MTLRKGLMAAAVAIMAMSATASAADTKRVLGDAEMDKVTAGVSFIFGIDRQFVAIFGLADPVGSTPAIVSGEYEGSPFVLELLDFNFGFPTNGTSTVRRSR